MIFLFYILLFLAIEGLVRLNWISKALLPLPSEILNLLFDQKEFFIAAFWQTASLALISFVAASLMAFLCGILFHQFRLLQKGLMPFALFLQTVPIIAMAPLIVIYLGFSSLTTITAALIVCFFPVLMATISGLKQVRTQQNELLIFLKASAFQRLIYLEIPSAMPLLLSGLKTSAGLAVIGVVSGEFLVGGGLGSLIDSARLQQRVDIVFSCLILLSLLGLILMKLVEFSFSLFLKKYLVRS